MTTFRPVRVLIASSLMLPLLSACGSGGGGDGPDPAPPAPNPPAPVVVPPPGGGVTSGDTFAITSTGRLVTFDRAAPALDTAIAVTGLQAGETIVGVDIRAGGATPGELYALGSTGRLYTVNTTSGVATLKSTLAADAADTTDAFTALAGTDFGIDFNPVADRLRVVSDTGQNLRINPDTGATITDGPLANGGATRTGVTGAGYTNAFADACRTALYYIDSTTDQLLTTTNPNGGTVTVVGALGVDTSAAGDVEIATAADGTNTAYAVLVVGGVPTSYQINLTTGAAATGGAVTRLDATELVRDIAIAPPGTAPTQLAGDVYALTEGNRLISFNAASPAKTCTTATLTGQQAGENILGIDVRPADAQLYALGGTGRLYTVDTATAALTLKSTLAANPGDVTDPFTALTGTEFGFDFNPGNDLIRIVSDLGANFRVLPDNGAVTTDIALNPAGTVSAAAAYSNNVAGVNTSGYFVVDATSDSLQIVGRPSGNAINGDLLTIGALGVGDVTSVGGFDIYGTNNFGLAAMTIGAATSTDLFNIDVLTGAATRVATIGGGERVRGLAFARTPQATAIGLTTANRLVTFAPTTPGTLLSDVAVSGLQGGEAIVGIDIRPSNGALYALTDAGRVYTLDSASGALSNAVVLAASATDLTSPFTALAGTRFGVDFSPLDGVLRVESDTGQNLRVDVDAGTVITDGGLNPGTPQIVGTAFSNSYVGAATTSQYVLDLSTNSLARQTAVSGLLTAVGGFNLAGTTFELEGGFDIVGGDVGLGIAALQVVGETQSRIYRVTLGNGSLTSFGAVGPAGTPAIRALAIRLQ